jgi:Flp pilus assembly protein TadD
MNMKKIACLMTALTAILSMSTSPFKALAENDNRSQDEGLGVFADTFKDVGRQEDFTAAMPLERKGIRQLNNGRYAEAEASFRAALKQYPSLAQAYHGLGVALEKQGTNLADAEAAYRSSLKLNTTNFKVWKRLANILYQEKKYSDARKAIADAISLNPPPKVRRELDAMIRTVEAGQSGN